MEHLPRHLTLTNTMYASKTDFLRITHIEKGMKP